MWDHGAWLRWESNHASIKLTFSKAETLRSCVLKNLTGLWGAAFLFRNYYHFFLTLHASCCVEYDIQCLVSLVSLHGRSDRGRNTIGFSVTNTAGMLTGGSFQDCRTFTCCQKCTVSRIQTLQGFTFILQDKHLEEKCEQVQFSLGPVTARYMFCVEHCKMPMVKPLEVFF